MHKFITHNGSYTLVLKPDGAVPVYDHKGAPVRVEGTVYVEFRFTKGTSVGVYNTNDDDIADRLRNHKLFGKSFNELHEGAALPPIAGAATVTIKLPKTALMACRKEELIQMANEYKIEVDDEEDTKKTLVDKILAKQEEGVPTPEEPTSINQIKGNPGEIRQIKQDARAN